MIILDFITKHYFILNQSEILLFAVELLVGAKTQRFRYEDNHILTLGPFSRLFFVLLIDRVHHNFVFVINLMIDPPNTVVVTVEFPLFQIMEIQL